MTCAHCPAPHGAPCPGDRAPRVCDLVATVPSYALRVADPLGLRRSVPGFPRPDDPRDPRPRACLVTPSLNIGGADRWMIALMEATAPALRWTGVAVASWANVVPAIREESDRLAPSAVGDDAIRAAVAASDLVVAWGLDMGWLAGLARSLGSPPIVGVSHGVGGWTAGLFADCSGLAAIVGVAPACARTFPESERGRVVTIANSVEPARLVARADRAATRAAWGIGPRERALVQVGRLSPEKNPEAIADAVASLHRRGHLEWRGVHVGTGWREAEARDHAERVAPGLVRFPGPTDDVASAYLAADALALPSREEACSLMMLESWWVGAPLIASVVGLTEDPEAAALCRPVAPGCSGRELADAVLADRFDPLGTRRRAALASRAVRARFSPAAFADRWTGLLLGLARPRAAALPASAPAEDRSGWSPGCGHRSSRWCCNQEIRVLCALGRGAGGIVEEHDCDGCVARVTPPPDPRL